MWLFQLSWLMYSMLIFITQKGLKRPRNYLWTSFSFSYSLKITCILLRQVISLKKMVVLSVTFTIVISWSAICIPLILLSAIMRWASTSATILFNSFESWHHWRAHVKVKGSDRRPFILILDSMLAYVICSLKRCEWICLHIRTYEKQKR